MKNFRDHLLKFKNKLDEGELDILFEEYGINPFYRGIV
jgi:hypothetical protein